MTWSLAATIDGSESCEDGSYMGYGGLVLWLALTFYIFAGLYVLCEDYFVPSLTILGEKWGLSEDVCGATLLAAGSSSNQLFTALLGVFLYPDDNPGPSTNCASAVWNMCIIVGASILVQREYTDDTRLVILPLTRDLVFYAISVICLYLFYDVTSEGQIDIYEAAILTLIWFLYVAVLVKDEPLQYWFNARLPCCDELNDTQRAYGFKNKDQFKAEIEFMENITSDPNATGAKTIDTDAGDAEKGDGAATGTGDDGGTGTIQEEVEASQGPQIIALKNDQSVNKAAAKNTKKSTFGSILKPSISEYDPTDDDRTGGAPKMSESVSHASRASRRKTTKSLIVRPVRSASLYLKNEMEKTKEERRNTSYKKSVAYQAGARLSGKEKFLLYFEYSMIPFKFIFEKSNCNLDFRIYSKAPKHSFSMTVTDAPSMYINSKQKSNNEQLKQPLMADTGAEIGMGVVDEERELYEMDGVDNSDVLEIGNARLSLAIFVCLTWMGILTWVIIDFSNKIGECLNLKTDVLGITLLAVGSSLPDTFSSVLVARQGKLSMAASTAFGSNIFDVCICVGLSFFLKTLTLLGTDEIVEANASGAFQAFIFAMLGLIVVFIALFLPYKLRAKKWHGWFLVTAYIIFIGTFSVILNA